MTIMEAIKTSKEKMEKKLMENPPGEYHYLRRYKDGLGILIHRSDKNFYVTDMFNIFGPFRNTKNAIVFLRVIRKNIEAHRQAMINSWESEKDTFGG